MERKNDGTVRVTFIDSIGVPYLKEKTYGGYMATWGEPVFDLAQQHPDTPFELGLLKVTSQYDRIHCNAWVAEFVRKTKEISELNNALWEGSSSINDSLIAEVFSGKRGDDKPDNLKLSFLDQLPPGYMMAVQKPGSIKAYIENYQGNDSGIDKLKKTLEKEIVGDYKLDDGREVATNLHLERKSLKYVLQLMMSELGMNHKDLAEFFRKNSPYYEKVSDSPALSETS